MNTGKLLLLVAMLSGFSVDTNAQGILKKLKKKAQDIVTKDNGTMPESNPGGEGSLGPDAVDCIGAPNPARDVKTDLKKEFYTNDIVVEMLNEENKKTISYFDVDALAMKSIQPGVSDKASYIDSEGFFYAYNKHNGYYEKSGMLSMGSMSLMGPSMMVAHYKLPNDPFWNKFEYLSNQKVKTFPFMYLEFTFLYKPEHFMGEGYTKVPSGQPGYTRFDHTMEGYKGSYVIFDDKDRLIEINIKADTDQFKGEGYFKYSYEQATVCLPEAKEVKMPGQGIFEKALDPNNN